MRQDVFPIRTSSDLVNWRVVGAVFPGQGHPAWARAPFYAPELHAVLCWVDEPQNLDHDIES